MDLVPLDQNPVGYENPQNSTKQPCKILDSAQGNYHNDRFKSLILKVTLNLQISWIPKI